MSELFLSFFEISVVTGVAAGVLMLLLPFLNRRYETKWSYYIWIFLAVRLLLPINGQAVLELAGRAASLFTQEQKTAAATPPAALPQRVVIEIPPQMTAPITAQQEREAKTFTVLDAAALVWMSGCVLALLFPACSYVFYRKRLHSRAKPMDDVMVHTLLQGISKELHLKRSPAVMEYDGKISPMITGIFRPVLVLPKQPYSGKELYFILRHELVHFKRHDVPVKLLLLAAGAVHWFNPLVRLMKRRAVVDMELSCDEQVIRGIAYADRKVYTETLFTMIQSSCTERTYLSTQFYEGKKIMKKRFRNIFTKNRKKNGLALFLSALALTGAAGMLVGCESGGAKADGNFEPVNLLEGAAQADGSADSAVYAQMAGTWAIDFARTENLWGSGISYGNGMSIAADGSFSYYIGIGTGGTGRCETDGGKLRAAVDPYEDHHEGTEILTLQYVDGDDGEWILMDWYGSDVYWKRAEQVSMPERKVLTFLKEGLEEQKEAQLTAGDGFALYLPVGEWKLAGPDLWNSTLNSQVQLWVTHFENASVKEAEGQLEENSYSFENGQMLLENGAIVLKVSLFEAGDGAWGVFYRYPVEAEEGWGRELTVIADTLMVTAGAGRTQTEHVTSGADRTQTEHVTSDADRRQTEHVTSGADHTQPELEQNVDSEEIYRIAEQFADAYFGGSAEDLAAYLADSYTGNIEVYRGPGTAEVMAVRGLGTDTALAVGSTKEISLEFKDSTEDSYTYLTFTFLKQADGWKVQAYWLEK